MPSANQDLLRSDPRVLPRSLRFLLAAFGLAALGAGVTAMFAVEGSGGAAAAALVTIGVLGVAVGALGIVPTVFKVGGVELTLPEKVQRLAAEAARQGRPDVAESLRQVSAELAATAEPFARIYDSIRLIFPAGDDRTSALGALVNVVERQAGRGRWQPAETRALFESGLDGARVFALAMMRARPRAEDLDLAIDAACHPRSRFEQWHGLTVVQRILPSLAVAQRQQLVHSLRSIGELGPGDRATLLDEILGVAEQEPQL
jgi:hypothetical protein